MLGGTSFFEIQLFINKKSQGRKLSAKPSCGNSALEKKDLVFRIKEGFGVSLVGINFILCHTTLELRDERSPCTMKPFSSTSLLAVPSKD